MVGCSRSERCYFLIQKNSSLYLHLRVMKFDRMIVFIMVMMIRMKFKLEFFAVCWEHKGRAKGCNRTGLSDHILISPGK